MDFTMMLQQLCIGLVKTVEIFILTLVFSLPLGLLISFGRMSKNAILKTIIKIYISIMRGTPLMLQLLVVFFGPFYLFKIQMPASYRFWAVIIGFTLNYAAYFAEIFRAGIDSIPAGQYEAGKILGYTNNQFFRKIVLPQMIKRVLPPVTNETVTLVKDTSLAFVLSYMEIFTIAKQVAAGSANIIPLFVAGVFYYVFNFAIAVIMEHIEKKLDYYR